MIIRDDVFENQKRLQGNLVNNYNPDDFEIEPEIEATDIAVVLSYFYPSLRSMS